MPSIRFKPRIDSHKETVEAIFRLARETALDLVDCYDWTLADVWAHVAGLEYRSDPKGVETISRARYNFSPRWKLWRDCDDKTVAIATWCELTRLLSRVGVREFQPYRLACVGQSTHRWDARAGRFAPAGPHHIYPEGKVGRAWLPLDATYPGRSRLFVRLYDSEPVREVYYPENFR